jgi:alpha-L-fucosidase 2
MKNSTRPILKYYLSQLAFVLIADLARAQPDLKLWYKQPAQKWTDALPIGNGRLGCNDIRRSG